MARTPLLRGSRLYLSALLAAASACAPPPESDQPIEVQAQGAALLEAQAWAYMQPGSSSASSDANANFSRSSGGGTMRSNRLSTGRYRVDIPNLGSTAGNAHVVAFGDDNKYCTLESWGQSGTTLQIFVRCYRPNGALVDSKFQVFYQRRTGTSTGFYGGYLTYNDGTQTVDPNRSWNSAGLGNTVERNVGGFVGYYSATLRGVGPTALDGHAVVTSLNTTKKCKILSYIDIGRDALVEVTCYDTAGNEANASFALSFSTLSPMGTPSSGYLLHDEVDNRIYTPVNYRRRIQINGTIKPDQPNDMITGTYFPGEGQGYEFAVFNNAGNTGPGFLQRVGGAPYVGAFSDGPGYCKIKSVKATNSADVEIRCFDRSGNPQDEIFLASWMTGQTQ